MQSLVYILKMIKRKTKLTKINKTNCYYSVSTSSSLNVSRKKENKLILKC